MTPDYLRAATKAAETLIKFGIDSAQIGRGETGAVLIPNLMRVSAALVAAR